MATSTTCATRTDAFAKQATSAAHPRAGIYEMVVDYVEREHAKLYTLAAEIVTGLQQDLGSDEDHPFPIALSLAEILEERLSTTVFTTNIKSILLDVCGTHAPQSGRALSERPHLTRQAMSHLLMAAMEMHTASGRTDAAFDLAEKALAAIGALRIMTNGGRVQP